MGLKEILQQIADPSLTPSERARLSVRLSKELEESGRYEEAREALREFWPHAGERPIVDGLDAATKAEVLCRVGVLTRCIGGAKQIEGAQEIAKDLISEREKARRGGSGNPAKPSGRTIGIILVLPSDSRGRCRGSVKIKRTFAADIKSRIPAEDILEIW